MHYGKFSSKTTLKSIVSKSRFPTLVVGDTATVMSWPILIACLAVVAVFGAAVFVRDELEAMARSAGHRIACAWMQCDEAL